MLPRLVMIGAMPLSQPEQIHSPRSEVRGLTSHKIKSELTCEESRDACAAMKLMCGGRLTCLSEFVVVRQPLIALP